MKHELAKFGYAFYQSNAPSASARALLQAQQNWPVFVVSPEVFSGTVCGKLDAAFLFKSKVETDEAMALEIRVALEHCSTTVSVFPKSEVGLSNLADHYATLKLCVPIRI